jgi:hypothetical protein
MVNKEKVRAFVTNQGTLIGEEEYDLNGFIKLKHPFRVIPQQDGKVAVAALFIKEEWCLFSKSNVIEIDVSEGMSMLYVNYEAEIFGSLIAPPEKKIII